MESKLSPGKRNTGVKCEWVSKFGSKCTNELTPAEVDYCEHNMTVCGYMKLCYGHQGQYKELLDQKYKDAYGSVKDWSGQ